MLNVATLISQICALLYGLLVMRFLNPADYGIWLGLNVLLAYTAHLHFGMEYGLGIRIPYYKAQENVQQVRDIESTVYTLWTGITMLASLGVGSYALLVDRPSIERWGLLTLCGLILFVQQHQFYSRWQTSALKDFSLISKLSVVRGVVSLILIVPLAWKYSIYGVMAGTFLISALMLLLWIWQSPFKPTLGYNGKIFSEMLRIGVPIALTAFCSMFLDTLDRAIILVQLGKESLGAYGITTLATTVCYGFVAQAGSALSPHIAEEMGKRPDCPEAMEKFLVKPTLVFGALSALAIIFAVSFLPLFVEVALPKYSGGVSSFIYFAPGLYFLALTLSANNILNLILIQRSQQRVVVYIQLIMIAVKVSLSLWLISLGWALPGVALASSITYFVYGLTIVTLSATLVIPSSKHRCRFLVHVMSPFFILLASLLAVECSEVLRIDSTISRICFNACICGLSTVVVLLWLDRQMGLFQQVRTMIGRA